MRSGPKGPKIKCLIVKVLVYFDTGAYITQYLTYIMPPGARANRPNMRDQPYRLTALYMV